MPSTVQVTKPKTGITLITIDRQTSRNAVDPETARQLYAAIIAFEEDESQKIAILNGANGTFCAGFDLKAVGQNLQEPHFEAPGVVERGIGPMGPSRLQVKKPLICAVSGYAVAGGLELSLLGDMRIVEEDAVFGVFCRRWGVSEIASIGFEWSDELIRIV